MKTHLRPKIEVRMAVLEQSIRQGGALSLRIDELFLVAAGFIAGVLLGLNIAGIL